MTAKSESTFLSKAPRFPKEYLATFWNVSRLCTFVLLIRAASTRITVRSTGGIILTGKNKKTRRKAYPDTIFSITKPKWTDLDLTHASASEERQREKKLKNKGVVKDFLTVPGGGSVMLKISY